MAIKKMEVLAKCIKGLCVLSDNKFLFLKTVYPIRNNKLKKNLKNIICQMDTDDIRYLVIASFKNENKRCVT
jgi:hypothetical protein